MHDPVQRSGTGHRSGSRSIDTIFGRGLLWLSDFRTAHYRYLLPFLPVAGLLIVWMYHRFSEESLKGMTLVLETGQKKRKSIPLALVPLVIVGTWLTHLFGGSAGREGVAVQIGAVISHEAGRKFRCPENDRIMLVAGMAAGFGGLFQTPLAAVFFAMEVIASGYMQYEALLPGDDQCLHIRFYLSYTGTGKVYSSDR